MWRSRQWQGEGVRCGCFGRVLDLGNPPGALVPVGNENGHFCRMEDTCMRIEKAIQVCCCPDF